MKSRTVSILDEADDFESKLRWILFKEENARAVANHRPNWWDGPLLTDGILRVIMDRDYETYEDHPEVWEPGVPLYRRPLGLAADEQTCRHLVDSYAELMDTDDDNDTMRDVIETALIVRSTTRGNYCVDCEVCWRPRNEPCWVCGEPGERPSSKLLVDDRSTAQQELIYYAAADADLSIRTFSESMRVSIRDLQAVIERNAAVMGRAMGEMARAFVAMDLARNRGRNNPQHIFVVTPHRAGRGQMMRMVFDEWVSSTPEVGQETTENATTVVNGIAIPAGFDPMRSLTELSERPDLLPEAPEIVLGRAAPRRWETPITEIRRSRRGVFGQ